jgi:transposase
MVLITHMVATTGHCLTNAEPSVLVVSCASDHDDSHLKIRFLESEIDDLRDVLCYEGRRLRDQISHFQRIIFGRRSEKISLEELGQLVLISQEIVDANQAESAPAEPVEPEKSKHGDSQKPKKRRPNHKGRTKIEPHVKRVVAKVIELPPEACHCGLCGLDLTIREVVVNEEVEHVPERLFVNVTLCQQGFCQNCKGDAVTATLGAQVGAPLSRAGSSLMANLIEAKCDDCLPIHRQCQRLARLGFIVPVNTLYGYWNECSSRAKLGHLSDTSTVGQGQGSSSSPFWRRDTDSIAALYQFSPF